MTYQYKCRLCGNQVTVSEVNILRNRSVRAMAALLSLLKNEVCSNCMHEEKRKDMEIMQHRQSATIMIDKLEV